MLEGLLSSILLFVKKLLRFCAVRYTASCQDVERVVVFYTPSCQEVGQDCCLVLYTPSCQDVDQDCCLVFYTPSCQDVGRIVVWFSILLFVKMLLRLLCGPLYC